MSDFIVPEEKPDYIRYTSVLQLFAVGRWLVVTYNVHEASYAAIFDTSTETSDVSNPEISNWLSILSNVTGPTVCGIATFVAYDDRWLIATGGKRAWCVFLSKYFTVVN
jgi:hypothetical protein